MTNATKTSVWVAALLALLGVGCDQGADGNVPEDGPPPIAGGGFEIVAGGDFAVASDPARAAIHVVDLQTGADRRIDLTAADEPGRIVEDQGGQVHVALRRAGEILTLDPASGRVLRRRAVCAAPRGLAIDPDDGQLVVACAEGQIVRLPTGDGGVTARLQLEPDLRDVIAYPGGRMLVSRFRSAEVLVIRGDAVIGRVQPPEVDEIRRTLSATVGWRMRPTGDEGAILVHQHSVSSQLGVLGGSSGVYYGGGCDTGVVRTAVSRIGVDWEDGSSDVDGVAVQQLSLGVDVAQDGDRVVVVGAAEPSFPSGSSSGFGFGFGGPSGTFAGPREISMRDFGRVPGCVTDERIEAGEDDPATGVAPFPGGGYAVLYRDPARIEITRPGARIATIPLDAGEVTHIGHALFHEAAGTGATCAGCHPEGGEDGHVWAFETGSRRSQTLLGGILETAPFHWDGAVRDSAEVMQGTFVNRMGGEMPSSFEVDDFATWMDRLPALPGAVVADADAVERGRLLFEREDVGCTSCHSGSLRTNNQTVNVGTEDELYTTEFQVPALYEVAYHAPYMHDGRAETLGDVLETHMGGSALSEAERGDMAAYLRSL